MPAGVGSQRNVLGSYRCGLRLFLVTLLAQRDAIKTIQSCHRTSRRYATQMFSSDAFINNKSLHFGLILSVEFTILEMFYVE